MKVRKKFAALLLSVSMVLTLLPAGALAATTPAQIVTNAGSQPAVASTAPTVGSLTITKSKSASTFAIYQLYGMKVNGGAYAYTTPNSQFASVLPADATALATYKVQDLSDLTKSLRGLISGDASTLKVYGEKAAGEDKIDPAVTKQQATGTDPNYKVTFSNLQLGYYLVIETSTESGMLASKDFLVSVPLSDGTQWNYNVTANCKDAPVTFNKVITNTPTDINSADDQYGVTRTIGDPVNYRLDADVPQYDNTVDPSSVVFEMHDNLGSGLYYKDSAAAPYGVKVYDISSGSLGADITNDFTVSLSGATNGSNLLIKCTNFKDIQTNNYTKVAAFYTAVLNASAFVGVAGNPNEAFLRYTDKPGFYNDSKHHKTYVYTFGLQILKTGGKDSQNASALDGATFGLYSDANCTALITSGITANHGLLNFKDLGAGTYYLKELIAPTGYYLMSNIVTVTIDAKPDATTGALSNYEVKYSLDGTTFVTSSIIKLDANNSVASVPIFDFQGFSLPGTGGIGTTIFFVSGIAIILLGGFMALVYTKKRKKSSHHFQH